MAIPRNFDYKNYDNLRQKSEILKKRDLFLNIVIISFILIISLLLYWALRDNKNIKTVEKKLNKTVTKPQIDKKALEEKKKKDEEIYRKKLAKEKRLKTASTILGKAIKAKEKGEQYLEKGLVSESNTFFKESLGFYLELKKYSHEELLELKITREELFYNLASLFFNINEIDKAKEIILSVVDEVRDKRYFISAGCIFIKSKEYDRALKYFEKAEKTDPKDGKINYYQGVIYSEKKDYSKAIIQFATAIKKGQKNANLYSNMGLLYSLTANYEESEKCYSKALELDSGNWQYYNILGNLNFIMGKPDKSRDYYLKALELSKNIPEIYYNLGTLELESENYKISKDYLKTLITRFPEFDMIKDVKNKLLKIEESIKKSAAKKNDNND